MNLEKEVFELALADVLPNRFQPREKFDDMDLQELSTSIKEHGVIQPIIVRKVGDKYEIVAGERRFRASQLAGKTSIPAIVRNIDDKESAKVALLENLQRKNLTSIEEARTYQTILKLDNLTQEELANTLGKSQSAIANKLRLLNLIPEVQDALLHEKISERHARSLLNLDDPTKQRDLLEKIIMQRMTVKQLDDEIAVMTGKVNTNTYPEEETEPKVEVKPVTNEPVINIPEVKEPEVPVKKPINKNIFASLRQDDVAETQDNNEDDDLPKDPYKDILEATYIPTTKDIKTSDEGVAPVPKYEGPKYEFNPSDNIDMPKNPYTAFNKIESLLNDNTGELQVENPNVNEVKEEQPVVTLEPVNNDLINNPNDIYDMRFAINNFRQAIQNTEKFGFKIETEEFDFDNVYQIVIKIDKNKKNVE